MVTFYLHLFPMSSVCPLHFTGRRPRPSGGTIPNPPTLPVARARISPAATWRACFSNDSRSLCFSFLFLILFSRSFNESLLGNIGDAIRQVTATPGLKVDQALEGFKTLAFDTKSAAEKAVKEAKMTVASLDSTVANIASLEAAAVQRDVDSVAKFEASQASLASSEAAVVKREATSSKILDSTKADLGAVAARISADLKQFRTDKDAWSAAMKGAFEQLTTSATALVSRELQMEQREATVAAQEKAAEECAD